MKIKTCLLLSAIFTLLSFFCLADETDKLAIQAKIYDSGSAGNYQRPKIGLVLSGGGARGAAHVGVIKKLEELQIPIDYIAGTSMGAIVGGLYASGMEISEIESTIKGLDWEGAFKDEGDRENHSFRRKRDDDSNLVKLKIRLNKGKPSIPSGIVSGQKIDLLLSSLTLGVAEVEDFDLFSIPFRAVATDIVTGDEVILSGGNLALAMRASMSIPAVLTPVEIDGKYLVDGGVSNNLPISVVRQMGADIVIAVDVSSPLFTRDQLNSLFSVTNQLSTLLTKRNSAAQIKTLHKNDVLITPDLSDVAVAEFDNATLAISKGYESVKSQRLKLEHIALEHIALEHIALDKEQYQKHISARSSTQNAVKRIHYVKLMNNSKLKDKTIMANISIKDGGIFDLVQLEKDIEKLYGWQLFENISYEISSNDNQETILTFKVNEKEIGTSYLQFGMELSDDFQGENFFNLAIAYTNPNVNSSRGEFRGKLQIGNIPSIGFEFYQPLNAKSEYFFHPQILYQKQHIPVFLENSILAEFLVKNLVGELALGRNFGNWGELKIGIRQIKGDASISIGPPSFPDIDFKSNELFVKLSYDSLDNFNFPDQGSYATLEWVSSNDELDSDIPFEQLNMEFLTAQTWGANTLTFRTIYGTTLSGVAPIHNIFTLGGFSNLSGFKQDQLGGQHYGLISGSYHKKIGNSSIMPFYFGGSLELGNVWQEKNEISIENLILAGNIFVGADTVLGPVYLAYGKAEGGIDSMYLFIDKTF